MNDIIKYPIGIQTFATIRGEGYIYVDKTRYIYDLVNSSRYVFLSRPRRFGKSLLLSTIEAYFKGRRDLFSGLAIDTLATDWTEHPTLRIDLSAEDYSIPGNLEQKLDLILSEMEAIYGQPAARETTVAARLRGVIRRAMELTGKKVVVLVDEYDKPMLANLNDDAAHERIRALLQGFYSVLKESDGYIRFAMLTGVTKFGHVSIFSGLNNLRDISLLPAYNAICGVTEEELTTNFSGSLADFAEANAISVSEARAVIKENYDGYHFSRKLEDLYNPFSLINAFQDCEAGRYWFRTASPSYLPQLLLRNNYPLTQLEGARRTADQLTDLANIDRDVVPLLYQSGYLTIRGWLPESEQFVLGFPNKEVSRGFWDSLGTYYLPRRASTGVFDINNFIEDVEQGRPENFMLRLQSLFADTESSHEADKEVHFQNMMVIVAKMCGFRTVAEYHMARGRCDMILATGSYIYIFEFKINGSAREALDQIEERGYAEPWRADRRKVFLIGANFSTATRALTDWIIA